MRVEKHRVLRRQLLQLWCCPLTRVSVRKASTVFIIRISNFILLGLLSSGAGDIRGFYFWKQSPRLNNAPPMAGMTMQHNCIPPKKKKMLSKESTYNLQLQLCLLCICYFIGLLYPISMKCNLFCWRKIECDFLHQRKNFWRTWWNLFIWPNKLHFKFMSHSTLMTSVEENEA